MNIEQQNWNTIAMANWSNVARGYREIKMKKQWFANCGRLGVVEASKFAIEKTKELQKRIESYEKTNGRVFNGGDDSFSDVTYHVVGLGQDTFNSIMQNPEKIKDIKYVESFSYILMENHKKIDEMYIEHFQEKVSSALGMLHYHKVKKDYPKESKEIVNEIETRLLAAIDEEWPVVIADFDFNKCYQWAGNQESARYSNVISDIIDFVTA